RPAPPAPAAIKAAPLPPAAQTGAPAAGAIKTEPLDMKKAEERAVKDVHASGGEMFTVKDGPKTAAQPKQTPPLQTSQTPPPPPQMPPPLPPPQTPAQSMPAAHAVPPAQAAPTIAPKAETAVVEENAPPEPEPPRGAGLVRYRTRGRDPFVPLVKDTVSTDLPRVENLRLVGILEDYNEKIALVEDFKNDNRAFALRANDEVEHGKVLRVQRDRVVFLIRDFDISRSYVLTLSAP
ncbi:MAG: hypothetical protein FWB85_11540, partial [Chitinispirillia bacterium]|nr:hypothetical protein [Chitinispirillia bacterium]